MSECSDMKRRVRSILRRHWLSSLIAFLIALIPALLVIAAFIWFVYRLPVDSFRSFFDSLTSAADIKTALLILISWKEPVLSDTSLLPVIPVLLLLAAFWLLIVQPIQASVSGYHLSLLRGKGPTIGSIFQKAAYLFPRYAGGMAIRSFWNLLWFIIAIPVPVALYLFATSFLGNYISTHRVTLDLQVWLYGGVILFVLAWFVVFSLIAINRRFAYCYTAPAVSGQPKLRAAHCVRLSRKMMRGHKLSMFAFYLSFVPYLLPSIVCLILWFLLPYSTNWVQLSEEVIRIIRIVLQSIIAANQLIWFYLAPYALTCFHASFIERKQHALMDQELTSSDFSDR